MASPDSEMFPDERAETPPAAALPARVRPARVPVTIPVYQPPEYYSRNLAALAQILLGTLAVAAIPVALLALDRPAPPPLRAPTTRLLESPEVTVSVTTRAGGAAASLPAAGSPLALPSASVPEPPHPPVIGAAPVSGLGNAPGEGGTGGLPSAEGAPANVGMMESGSSGPASAEGAPVSANPPTTASPRVSGPAVQTAWQGQTLPRTGALDFDAYSRWLQSVELERERLRLTVRARQLRTAAARREIPGPVLGESAPAGMPQASASHAPSPEFDEAVEAVRSFNRRTQRLKPPVPADCMTVDRYYAAALQDEVTHTLTVLEAAAKGESERLYPVRRTAVPEVDRNLDQAETELERAWSRRGARPPFRLRTGSTASLLGELTGPDGLR